MKWLLLTLLLALSANGLDYAIEIKDSSYVDSNAGPFGNKIIQINDSLAYVHVPGNHDREKQINDLLRLHEWNTNRVLYKDPNLLVLEAYSYKEGGAHPTETYYGINVDVNTPKIIEFGDVFSDMIGLKLLLRKKLAAMAYEYFIKNKSYHNIGDPDEVIKMNLDDAYADAFALTEKGVYFYYNYCHFSCVVGYIKLWVPYEEMRGILIQGGNYVHSF